MYEDDPILIASQLGADMDTYESMDSLTRGRYPSLLELVLLNTVMGYPSDARQLLQTEDGNTVQRLTFEHMLEPLQGSTDEAYVDLTTTANGEQFTVVDLSQLGDTVYKVDRLTGKTSYTNKKGKEKRARNTRKRKVAHKLKWLVAKY